MLFLFLSEMSAFLSTQTVTNMFVNPDSDAHQLASRLTINIDIVMPALPCSRKITSAISTSFLPVVVVSVDAQDVMGNHHLDVGGALVKSRLNRYGKPKSSVFLSGINNFNLGFVSTYDYKRGKRRKFIEGGSRKDEGRRLSHTWFHGRQESKFPTFAWHFIYWPP